MKRPAGVVFSAVILIVLSLLQLLGAAFMALAGLAAYSQASSGRVNPYAGAQAASPAQTLGIMLVFAVVLVGMAAWGIATSVGLFRMKQWSRYSVLILGGLKAIFGAFAFILCIAVMFAAAKMPIPGENPQATRTVMVVMFSIALFVYGLITLIGIWWLVYFNLRSTRAAFGDASGVGITPGQRPLWISVLSIFSLIGAAELFVFVFTMKYAFVITWPIYGAGKAAYYLLFAALETALGIGLWKLKPWAWWTKIILLAFSICLMFTYSLAPSTMARMPALVNLWNAGAGQAFSFVAMMRLMFFMCGIIYAVWIVVLICYRKAFQPPLPPDDAAPLEPVGVLSGPLSPPDSTSVEL